LAEWMDGNRRHGERMVIARTAMPRAIAGCRVRADRNVPRLSVTACLEGSITGRCRSARAETRDQSSIDGLQVESTSEALRATMQRCEIGKSERVGSCLSRHTTWKPLQSICSRSAILSSLALSAVEVRRLLVIAPLRNEALARACKRGSGSSSRMFPLRCCRCVTVAYPRCDTLPCS